MSCQTTIKAPRGVSHASGQLRKLSQNGLMREPRSVSPRVLAQAPFRFGNATITAPEGDSNQDKTGETSKSRNTKQRRQRSNRQQRNSNHVHTPNSLEHNHTSTRLHKAQRAGTH